MHSQSRGIFTENRKLLSLRFFSILALAHGHPLHGIPENVSYLCDFVHICMIINNYGKKRKLPLCMESLDMFHVSFCPIFNEYKNNEVNILPLWDRLSSSLLEAFPPGRRNRT